MKGIAPRLKKLSFINVETANLTGETGDMIITATNVDMSITVHT